MSRRRQPPPPGSRTLLTRAPACCFHRVSPLTALHRPLPSTATSPASIAECSTTGSTQSDAASSIRPQENSARGLDRGVRGLGREGRAGKAPAALADGVFKAAAEVLGDLA